ncbi:MAG: GH3 auxin-responsive promoter family protein [Saprospiraceae bacterium]|nr:GH3 auxin-responsive promoter family protein [Saprospiraceae bacterium]
MLLLLDNAIFYEFIPINQIDDENPNTLTLEDVEVGKDYLS